MNARFQKLNVLIAGGGTGGHLFPGIALAEEFLRKNKQSEISFVGTMHGIEARVLPAEGWNFHPVIAYGLFGKSALNKFKGLFGMIIGVFQSLFILLKIKPHIVIGVGGYASAPVMMASVLLRKRVVIQEQNSVPGFVNKFFARFSDLFCLSFEKTKEEISGAKKLIVSGNPLRKEEAESEALNSELTTTKAFRILIFGGSQGAQAINNLMIEAADKLKEIKGCLFILHQSGEAQQHQVEESYKKAGLKAEVKAFIPKLFRAYQYVDLVVSRAGATTLAELCTYGKPSILIPLPTAIKNHQELNARELEAKGGTIVLLERETNAKELAEQILTLYRNKKQLQVMGENAKTLAAEDPAKVIVEACYALLNKKEEK